MEQIAALTVAVGVLILYAYLRQKLYNRKK